MGFYTVRDPELAQMLGLPGPDPVSDDGEEKWRPVSGWRFYEVSSWGRVRRVRLMTPQPNGGGYQKVNLSEEGAQKAAMVHRLVAEAFHGPCPDDKQVAAHKDDDPNNNYADNIYWATALENAADRKGRGRYADGEGVPTAKLTNAQAREIRMQYHEGGVSIVRLAAAYSVTRPVIARIVRGKGYQSAGGHGL